MGKVQQGILDGFVGKVGTVVGSFWKGKPTMRAYKRTVRDARTSGQDLVCLRFSEIAHIASGFERAFNMGLANAAREHQMTTGNYFIQKNWGFVNVINTSFYVDFDKLIISEGNLFPETVRLVDGYDGCIIDMPLDPTPYGNQTNMDKVWLVVYSRQTNTVYMDWSHRNGGHVRIQAPPYEADNSCIIYTFGEQNGMFSKSVYNGEATFKPYVE